MRRASNCCVERVAPTKDPLPTRRNAALLAWLLEQLDGGDCCLLLVLAATGAEQVVVVAHAVLQGIYKDGALAGRNQAVASLTRPNGLERLQDVTLLRHIACTGLKQASNNDLNPV